ncbi:ABC transporter permease [Arthrobacter cupressi]|uniref:Peptide/nickel transport system permease protein n=1 Tax=Arthrobacter cupressi TaxID=1045773 RepID=A0A1G8MUY9_9MICC|nr:ABC transporter permease [Arthrobacter cupressi]NYD76946.1 peptide/nickel transport system permease protein [Arthrobacter cupressi]SDI71752.1 peptide/nickel transport system permease protein [Arthrobacter cupressi]
MTSTLLKRLGVALATIFGASIFTFVLLRKVPGDPARAIAGDTATEETVAALRQSMGLDDNLFVQYGNYMGSLLRGDFGFSYSTGNSVGTLLGQRLPATLELGLLSVIIAIVAAVLAASFAVYSRRRWPDQAVRAASSLAMGSPPFWIALLALMVFSIQLGIFPGPEGRLSPGMLKPPNITGMFTVDSLLAGQWGTFANAAWHLILPAAIVTLGPFAFLSRLYRNQLRGTLRETFVAVSRSHGLRRLPVYNRHVAPHGLLSLLPAASLLFADLLAGSLLVEKVFGWPGIGSMTADAIIQKDFAVVQAVLLLAAVLYVVVSLLADLLMTAADPRTRVGAR